MSSDPALARALELRRAADYRAALAELAELPEPSLDALLELGRLQEELGDYDEAERTYRSAAVASGDDASRARAVSRIAGIYRWTRRLAAAESSAEEALALARRSGDPGAKADALIELANARIERSRHEAVLPPLREALPLIQQLAGLCGDRLRHGAQLTEAALARERGRYPEAESILRDAIAHAERAFGPRALETAAALNALGVVFKYAGRFDDGKKLYLRALAIIERAGGPDHPDVAAIYHNLGGLEHARRNYDEAEPHARRSVEVRKRALGRDHPTVAEDEAAHAAILHALGRDDEAEPLLRHAIEVLESIFGPDHQEVAVNLNNLASVLVRKGDLDEARTLHERALAAKERTLGPDHPSVANSLNNLAVIARRQGRTPEAESLYRRALAILEAAVEPTHPNLATTRRNLSRLLRDPAGPVAAGELDNGGKIEGEKTV